MSMRDPTPSAPDAALRRGLLDSLRDLERDPAGAEKARRHLMGWLADPADPSAGPHLELRELRDLSARRDREGSAFRLPAHLLECKACMELFQVLRAETPSRPAKGASEGGKIAAPAPPRARPRLRFGWQAVPAAILVFLAWSYLRAPGLILESGALRQESGIQRGGRLPARRPLEALQGTRIDLLDGSSIHLEPGARIRVGKTLGLRPLLVLQSGQARFEFRDARTAPEVRAGDLRVIPASAGFELVVGLPANRLTVLKGGVECHRPNETLMLRQGDIVEFP